MNHNDDQETKTATPTGVEARLARHGGLSYLHIPAVDVHQSAAFYEQVFGWKIHGRDTGHPGFDDGTGHVSGAWVTDQAISREPGLLPYIYVDRIDDAIEQVEAQGGEEENSNAEPRAIRRVGITSCTDGDRSPSMRRKSR